MGSPNLVDADSVTAICERQNEASGAIVRGHDMELERVPDYHNLLPSCKLSHGGRWMLELQNWKCVS